MPNRSQWLLIALSGWIVGCQSTNMASISCYQAKGKLSVVMGVRRVNLSSQTSFEEDPTIQAHPHITLKPGVKIGTCRLHSDDAEKLKQAGIPLR